MQALELINYAISVIFAICYFYQIIYIPISWLSKKKTYKKAMPHRFAALICARNEENVISELIESLKAQSYSGELLDIFVMADNCTDGTANVARIAGAYVYERTNTRFVGKGYALNELLHRMEKDFSPYDAYFVFDADNILEPDYICQINKMFSDGYDIITSRRNSKNYGDNWISAGYALWFLRESRYLNGARQAIGSSCAVSGTGFMFSRRILEKNGGYPYHLLTEDIEFSVAQIIDGEKIGYCGDAMLYDEQPISFRQSFRQRMRWSKGYFQVFAKYGKYMIKGMLHGSFPLYDMCMTIMPAFLLSTAAAICNIITAAVFAMRGDDMTVLVISLGSLLLHAYEGLFALGLITTVTEWKDIKTSTFKKILYAFTFPLFMFTYIPISFSALFSKVTWKPIVHGVSKSTVRIGK